MLAILPIIGRSRGVGFGEGVGDGIAIAPISGSGLGVENGIGRRFVICLRPDAPMIEKRNSPFITVNKTANTDAAATETRRLIRAQPTGQSLVRTVPSGR